MDKDENKYSVKDAMAIGDKVGCDFDNGYSIEEFCMGLNEEAEHFSGDNSIASYINQNDQDTVLGLLVKQSLDENDEYYSDLEDLEARNEMLSDCPY